MRTTNSKQLQILCVEAYLPYTSIPCYAFILSTPIYNTFHNVSICLGCLDLLDQGAVRHQVTAGD